MKRKPVVRLLAVLLMIVMIVSLAACGKGDDSGTESNTNTDSNAANTSDNAGSNEGSNSSDSGSSNAAGSGKDTLRFAFNGDFGTFDYTRVSGGNWYGMMGCLNEPLWDVVFNEQGELEPVWLLATGYDVISPTQWTVHLREGVKFSNGNPFTAEDVLFTWYNEINNPMGGIRAQSIDYDNSKIIDDYTIDMRFLEFNAQGWIAYTDMFIFDAESYADTDFGKTPVGTGPYTVTEYLVNSHVIMERRDDYWGDPPAIKTLEFRNLTESSQVVNALETGLVDVGPVAGQDFDYVSSLPGYEVILNTEGSWSQIGFNVTENSIFNNIDARFAVAYALDREAINRLVFEGRNNVMKGPIAPKAADYEDRFDYPHEVYRGQDLEKAKQLAESSGLAGQTIVLIIAGQAEYVLMAEIVQGQLKEIGVTVDIRSYEGSAFMDISRDYTAYDCTLGNGICPNKMVGDTLFMQFRYSTMIGPENTDSFPGWARYMEIYQDTLFNADAKVRSDSSYECIQIWGNACFRFSITDLTYAYAYSTDLQGPFLFRASQQRRFQDFQFK